ncbi:MAG TPA: bifunctional demethylmenaquinone methyltransferase/2-methoxy-6-polyprenyl-1,4-benzoquinol methylase UbiE [Flavobacteriales bacterium]|nr:bifunctional demethylmenaquinone methyltransferase/2-methoxy-6-polyprenyl-1,4-benzoquinol methylase UbiE [Flavobacteriales bacterium]
MGTPVTPYASADAESKKQQVARMFDNIAHSYDFLNHLFSFGIDVLWRKRTIRILKQHWIGHAGPFRLMDMATGTADFAIEALRMNLKDTRVTGVDISPGMLEVGRKKVTKRGWDDRIELIEGDSADLPFDDATFDAYTVAFGVRNFENLDQGMKEMFRVLKPGGMGLVLEFSKPKNFPMKQLFGLYFKFIMPTIGRLVSKDAAAYSYLPESVAAFPEGPEFMTRMGTAGYQECRQIKLTGGIASIYTGTKPMLP